MPNNIVITEGKDTKIFRNISKLVTKLANGDTCNWIQEDSVNLITKTIVKDGTYIARNDVGSPYGYSQIIVNGIGNKVLGQLGEKNIVKNGIYEADKDDDGPYYGYSVIVVNVPGGESDGEGGKPTIPGKDGDGDDAVATTDDDGSIITKKLPSEIRVIAPPDILEYEDGQSIVFDGLLVKAFYPDGTEYSSIPTTDLIKPVKVAVFDGEAYSEAEQEKVNVLLDTINAPLIIPIPVSESAILIVKSTVRDKYGELQESVVTTTYTGSDSFCIYETPSAINIVAASENNEYCSRNTFNSYTESESNSNIRLRNTYTYDDKKVYWASINVLGFNGTYSPQKFISSNSSLNNTDIAKIAWAIVYSKKNGDGGELSQGVPLQWRRPGDAKVLETSFTITVSKPEGDNNSSGGNTTPGNTNIDVPQ